MAQPAPARTKINTKVTQPAPGKPSRRPAGRPGPGRPPKSPRVSGDARDSVRQPARPVIEMDFGILVYPPEAGGEPWRAVFTENGQRKYRQGRDRGEAGRQAGEGHRAAPGRRGEHGAARRGPDRALPGPGPAAGRAAVVPQACAGRSKSSSGPAMLVLCIAVPFPHGFSNSPD